jgi:hypothetical protein
VLVPYILGILKHWTLYNFTFKFSYEHPLAQWFAFWAILRRFCNCFWYIASIWSLISSV